MINNHSASSIAGLFCVVGFIIVALLAPLISPHDPNMNNLLLRLGPPSSGYWLGNDELGRDILSRIIWGARTSLIIAGTATFLALVIAVPMGLLAGHYGGTADAVISGIIDVLMAFPGILLALAVVATFGMGLEKLIFALALYSVPTFARLTRAMSKALRNQEYVQAAHALGQRTIIIMLRHILRNCLGPLIVEATSRLGTIVLTAATLSFLGLGIQPPDAEWGAMIASSSGYMRIAPHATIFPGIALTLLVMGFSFAGDGLRDVLDSKKLAR